MNVRTNRLATIWRNLTLLSCTKKFKTIFFPWAVKLWNSLQINVRNSSTLLNIFKARLKPIYCSYVRKIWLSTSLNCWANILHTRLRLGSHALNEHLLKIKCRCSPLCHYGTDNETVEHYFSRLSSICCSMHVFGCLC